MASAAQGQVAATIAPAPPAGRAVPVDALCTTSIVVGTDDPTGRWEVSPERLVDWVRSYDAFWMEKAGISAGRDLHRLYGRSTTVVGGGLHRCVDELEAFTFGVQAFSLPVGVTLPVTSFRDWPDRAPTAFRELGVSSVAITIEESECEQVDEALVERLAELPANGVLVTIVGWLHVLKEKGFFSLPAAQQNQVALLMRRYGAEHASRRVEYSRPCHNRLGLVVGTKGYIYPCMGLAGLPNARLGHIDDPVPDLFRPGANPALDLAALAAEGPDHPKRLEMVAEEGATLDCILHRRSLMGALDPAAPSSPPPRT